MRTVLPRPQVSPGPGKGARRGGRGPGRPPTPAPVRSPRPRVAPGIWLFNPSRRALCSCASRTCCPISVNTIKLGKRPGRQRFPTSGAGLGKAIPFLPPKSTGAGKGRWPGPGRASARTGPAPPRDPRGGWGDLPAGRGAAFPPRSVLRVSQRIPRPPHPRSARCHTRTRGHRPTPHSHTRTAEALAGKKDEKPQLRSPLVHLLRFSSAQ